MNTDNSLSLQNGATCRAGGVWTNASSRELKENINELSAAEALATLDELNPVKFTYKADRDENHVGFIAEEVPNLVATKDRKGLSTMDIVAVVTKVAQEQRRTIDEQQAKINEQQAEITALRKELRDRIEKLEAAIAAKNQ